LTSDGIVVVVGMGEVGRPLFQILSRKFECAAVDIEPVEIKKPCSALHICYPFQAPNFVGTTAGYIQKYRPAVTIINSTIAPGTTRKVQALATDQAVAYSPVRGKHAKMESDMLRYKKFVAACHPDALNRAVNHFSEAGFKTATFPSPELGELAKLLETTYLGILIAWAQEVERLAAQYGGKFEDVNAFVEEIDFLPSGVFPGRIGGHCVMPNIAILRTQLKSKFLDTVVESNEIKEQQLKAATARDSK
jgi:UDP-N-acetyl-D-mannosaminuronate dehydrogenase